MTPSDALASVRRFGERVADLPPVRKGRAVMDVYNGAGGGLLSAGLAYNALVAGLTGLLFAVGVLGYLVPSEAERRPIIDAFSGQLASLAPAASDALAAIAAHAGAFSLVGLAGLGWGASQFYGALDGAMGRVFDRAPARGLVGRIGRGLASVFLLVGGLFSGIAISTVQAFVSGGVGPGFEGNAGRIVSSAGSFAATAAAVTAAVALLYRVVPNTHVPFAVLRLPALVAGLALTALTHLLVYITPMLAGALSIFGSVAVVFAAVAWLNLAFQAVLLGAAWTRVRLDDRAEREGL